MHAPRNALRMISGLGAKSLPFAARTAFVLDHYSPPPNIEAANTHVAMREFADKHGSPLYDVGDGICHQVLPEGGHLTCGDLVVGTDTHSTTYGAFNAFGTGVEGTDVSAVMMTGKLWFRVPETIRIELKGALQPGVWAKDVTLTHAGQAGRGRRELPGAGILRHGGGGDGNRRPHDAVATMPRNSAPRRRYSKPMTRPSPG